MIKKIIVILILTTTACRSYEFKEDVKRVAAVGDSITYGFGILDRQNDSYPQQLEELLGDNIDVVNFGSNGATLQKKGDRPYWREPVFQKAIHSNPDVVIITLGTNDSKRFNWTSPEDFKADYVELVETFSGLPSSPLVVICTPLPAFNGMWSISNETIINEIIPIIYDVGTMLDIKVIDLYTPLKTCRKYFPDSIHPNAKGAALIARTIYRHM